VRGRTVIKAKGATGNFGIQLGDIRCEVCPLMAISEQSLYYLDLYNGCTSFHCLPRPGGYLEQDNKTLEAFSVIRSEYNKMDKEHQDEMKRKARQGR
jgi:hypothetical protein